MMLDFIDFINESSIKKAKKEIRGVLSGDKRKKMKKLLHDHIVTFKFRKRNGDIRLAHGTLHSSYLPPLKGGSPRPFHQFVYYDLDKKGWRSFRTFTFIKIIDIEDAVTKSSKHSSSSSGSSSSSSTTHSSPSPHHISSKKKSHDEDEDTKTKKIESEKEEETDEKKKTFKAGEKMSEKELLRRSTDFRKGTRKNKTTKEANDKFKAGELDDEPKKKDKHRDEKEHKEKSEDE